MDKQKQDDKLESTYSSSVPIQDVALKTYQKTIRDVALKTYQKTIGRGGGKGSEINVLIA